jgi:hypothetical protein
MENRMLMKSLLILLLPVALASISDLYPDDRGIETDPAVIWATGFETPEWHRTDLNQTGSLPTGYEHTTDGFIVLSGNGSLQIQQRRGTHQPYEFHPWLPGDYDKVHLRWYRMYEAGYNWTQHKMPGVYARYGRRDVGGDAGIKPNGTDKFSCKLFVDWHARPKFYAYHPDQAGIYGDEPGQNIGEPIALETERWYCFEMMLKANAPGQHDGELKMWIDGELKGHITGMRFRDIPDLKINQFTHSAYVGGTWTAVKDQKLWEDNLVIATEYIGPMNKTCVPPTMQQLSDRIKDWHHGDCSISSLMNSIRRWKRGCA